LLGLRVKMGEENSEEKVWLRRENGKEKKDIM